MSKKVDDVAGGAKKDDNALPEAINDGQATVLYRKVETKHKL